VSKNVFYVLANKKESQLGYFLFMVDSDHPQKDCEYLIHWKNKLDIANCDLQMMEDQGESKLVVSYKAIGINTYNVFVFSLKSRLIEFWHESNQLWESPVKGFLLNTNDFMILSKDGINIIAIGHKEPRIIKDSEGWKRKILSLGNAQFLRVEPTNHILFSCQFYENRQVCVQEQYNDLDGNTHFDDIYRVKINEPTVRELLLIQSIYACGTQSDIEKLVSEQPTPKIFFKVFLELSLKSLIPFIAFDSRSMKKLLGPHNNEFFSEEFPVFYKNVDGTSAIDTCLDRNQIRSVNLMIEYIIGFQNSYVYANLFKNNFVDLINKGVTLAPLLKSRIFNHTFDFDEWPSTNSNTTSMLKAYNGSIFDIRHMYPVIFRKVWKDDMKREQKEMEGLGGKKRFELKSMLAKDNSGKQFKMRYQINLLPSMSEDEGQIIQAIANSEELELFKTDAVKDLVNYKWGAFASSVHWFGWLIHMLYIISLQMYITKIYLADDIESVTSTPVWLYVIGFCLLYPAFYDGKQMYKQGWAYLDDPWNYLDVVHISQGYLNLVSQFFFSPFGLLNKIMMICVVFTCLMKQFFFMRVVMSFSYIVTMIVNVVSDLRVFLLFYAVLMVSFSMVFNVIAHNDSPEYRMVGSVFGNLLTTMRLSLGDFDFTLLEGLSGR